MGKTIRLSLLTLGEIYVTVTGVFDAEDDFSRYDSLRVPELPGDAEATALRRNFPKRMNIPSLPSALRGRASMNVTTTSTGAAGRMQQVENYGGTTSYTYSMPYAYLSGQSTRGRRSTSSSSPVIGSGRAACSPVFAALLLFSFISASINAKKKDIGILRAVGARGIDVFKIFIVEGIAITLLCLVLGVAGSIAACAITNGILIAEAGLGYEFFLFGWENALILFGIAAVTSLIATVIPVAVFSKKRPVETIRSV